MESRRDQVHAYFFVVGRLAAAVTHGRPNAVEWPNHRFKLGIIIGILISALLVGIFGIIGLISPGGNTAWRKPGTIVVVEGSSTGYVYLHGKLRPVLNQASAVLASGESGNVVSVSGEALRGTPVGQPVGIPGAPDRVPAPGQLYRGAWTVCVRPGHTTGDSPVVTVLFGDRGGSTVARGDAVLVSTPDGTVYMLWHGTRHRIAGQYVLTALGYVDEPVRSVPATWLSPIPAGPKVGVRDIPGLGEPGPRIGEGASRVGQILHAGNSVVQSSQYYLVRADGLEPVSRTVAALILAKPSTRRAYPNGSPRPIPVGTTALKRTPTSTARPELGAGLPRVPPNVSRIDKRSALCARYTSGTRASNRVSLRTVPAPAEPATAVAVATHTSGETADRVVIPYGSAALVRARHPKGPVYLISASGTRYPLGGPDVLKSLGYTSSNVVGVSRALLELLPRGPVLSIDAALQPVTR